MEYIISSKREMIMKKETNNITEAQLLLNQQVRVNMGTFTGRIGIVKRIMADGRSLEVSILGVCGSTPTVLLDVTLVSEVHEPTQCAKTKQSLGPDANSVLPHNRL